MTREFESEAFGDDGEGQRALRADARRNKARVLDAVRHLLANHAPDELSMESVAREADIGKATLYRHYPDRECLYQALIEDGTGRIGARMRELIPPDADALTKLHAMVTLMYDAYDDNRLSIDLLLSARLSESIASSDRPQHPISAILTRLRGILEQGVREGVFRPLDVDFAAGAVFSLISPLAYIKQRERLGYSRAMIEERTLDLLQHALRSANQWPRMNANERE